MRKRLFRVVVAGVALAAVTAAIFVFRGYEWKRLEKSLEAEFGVDVVLENVDFPGYLRAQETLYRLTLSVERSSVLRRLRIDLSRYEPEFIANHLHSIVILRSLEIGGAVYGGTYDVSARRIYIDSGWLGDDGSHGHAMGLHHELSSLLLYQHPDVFSLDEWASLNASDHEYKYARSTKANIESGRVDLLGGPDTWKRGFVCEYGTLTAEDDINTFAQHLVAKKSRWVSLIRTYPSLRRKMLVLRSWYCEIGAMAGDERCGDSL